MGGFSRQTPLTEGCSTLTPPAVTCKKTQPGNQPTHSLCKKAPKQNSSWRADHSLLLGRYRKCAASQNPAALFHQGVGLLQPVTALGQLGLRCPTAGHAAPTQGWHSPGPSEPLDVTRHLQQHPPHSDGCRGACPVHTPKTTRETLG